MIDERWFIEIIDHPVDFELVDPPPKFSYHSRFTPFPVVGKGRSGRLSNSSRLTSLLRLFARQVSVCFHEFDNRIVRLCNSSIRYVSPLYPNGCYRERNLSPRIYRPCDRASPSLQRFWFALNGWIKSLAGGREDTRRWFLEFNLRHII